MFIARPRTPRRLAIAFDDHRGDDAFARRLAAEHVHRTSENAGQLEVRFLVGANVRAGRRCRQERRSERED
jgi:hypothetical protein